MTNKSFLSALGTLIGVLLVLVGIAFLLLVLLLRVRGELAGDIKVSTLLFCVGVILIWVGCTFLFSSQRPHESVCCSENDRYILTLRGPVEFGALVGLILSVIQATAVLYGADWVPARTLWAVDAAPVLIGLFALRILKPGAFQSGVFRDDVISRWSVPTRKLVSLLLRIGWLGYLVILLTWSGLQDLVPWTEHVSVRFTARMLISLLYASQVVVLHFGQTRPTHHMSI